MNVSQQEYETKYAEYLERVNRRQSSLATGRTEDGWYEQRQLFRFPGSDHTLNHRKLRRKRSLHNDYDLVYIRFDIPTRNASTGELTGFQSPSLYHDPRPAPDDEAEDGPDADGPASAIDRPHRQSLSELPPISPENIEESSLNIMLTRRQNSARSTNAPSKHQHRSPQPHQVQQSVTPSPAQAHQHQLQAHGQRRKGRVRFKPHQQHQASHQQQHHAHHSAGGRTVTIHAYQLVEPYERHFLTSKTVAVQEIPPNGSRWYQLPLEEAVRTWLDGSRKNLGLELYCEGCHAHDVHIVHESSPYFRSYDETPVLNVVGRLVQREKRSKLQRYRPQMRDYLSPPKTTACTAGNKRCCRHPLLVDFRDIEGFDFIIQPKIFDAGFCRGRCPTKFNPATHHALLQSLLHEHIKYDVPKPCCAPSSLDHIDVLHADPKNPQRLKVSTWHNMRVLELFFLVRPKYGTLKMPLYETMLQEKPAIVLEIGTALTKLGFAGEPYPRSIIPSEVLDHQAKNAGQTAPNRRLFDYTNEVELYDWLVEFLNTIFFKYVLVSPKDRKVVIVESVLCPTIIKEKLARALFFHFDVSSVFFVPTHLVVLATLAVETALVVDIGYKEAAVVPVFCGVQALYAWEAQPLAAESVHNEIRRQLIESGVDEKLLTESTVEDIKIRTCFVTTAERAAKYRADGGASLQPCPDVDYPAKGEAVIKITGRLRETAYEVMFPEDNDRLGLPYIVLNAILKCPRDTRITLANNLILIGGSTMVQGLAARLKAELLALLQTDLYKDRLFVQTFKFHKAPAEPNFTAWLGGSIYGATDLVLTKSITREAYAKNQTIPDFTNYEESRGLPMRG
uniref:TGF-beta family profile domain-containing protein n=1 Tax=Anopheles epiroticus TaxID=199890 RepID=A0A182P1D4_9DIPT